MKSPVPRGSPSDRAAQAKSTPDCSIVNNSSNAFSTDSARANCEDTISVEAEIGSGDNMTLKLDGAPYSAQRSQEVLPLSQNEAASTSEIPNTLEPHRETEIPTQIPAANASPRDTLRPGKSDSESIPNLHALSACPPPPPFPSSDSFGLNEILGYQQSSDEIDVIPMPGESLGRYRVLDILAKGGMGQILRARDEILQREVAIKIILPELLHGDPTAGLSFLREAEIVASLPHPHIIHVLDAGLEGTTAFLVFGYIKGENISDFCRRTRPNLGEIVDLLLPVISAVKLAHDKNVVHGDLKPKNILVEEDYRGRGHPWVLDFGASFHSGIDRRLDPMRGRVGGTPGYLAPEWMTKQDVDGRADCFSLGCVFYELLVGRGPFSHCSRLSEVLSYAKTRDFPPPSQMVPIPSPIDDIIHRCLDPNPDTRYPDIKSLARELLPFATARGLALWRDEFALD